MHDCSDISGSIATFLKELGYLLQIGDGIKIAGRLFAPKATIEIATNGRVTARTCELADMVDMVDYIIQRHQGVRWIKPFTDHPARFEHPGIESRTDHPIAGNDRPQLIVAELALMRDQCTTVVVARENWATVVIQGLPERLIRAVGEIEEHTQAIHFTQQWWSEGGKTQLGSSTTGITAGAIMGNAEQT
jgi:hypothetical protein